MKDQNLDRFIAKLMSDDQALNQFLADPTNGGKEYGITKAARAVVRRVVSHLSNNAKNGFSIQRDLGSYRRSLRLLQNVLHQHSAQHLAMANVEDSSTAIRIYITGDPSQPGAPYDNPALAYTNFVTYTVAGTFSTIGEAMSFNPPSGAAVNDTFPVTVTETVTDQNGNVGNLEYTAIYLPMGGTSTNEWYMLSYTLSNFASNINGTYELGYNVTTERQPFWYFSLNGAAISPNSNQGYSQTSGVTQGNEAEGFQNFPLNGSVNIDWQPIAADLDYGFGPCFTVNAQGQTVTPALLGIPILQKSAQPNPPTNFYRNTATNVLIKPNTTITLACNPDGTGNIYTDDQVVLTVNGNTFYTHDYSNGCSGVITPTAPVDVTALLAGYVGQYVSIGIAYNDLCGGVESSSGFFLVFTE